jgi:hypothetical protein
VRWDANASPPATEPRRYRTPEDQWPGVQDAIIKNMDRLEKALRPHLKQLKQSA